MPNLLDILKQQTALQNYSPKTTGSYTSVAKQLYRHFKKPLNTLTNNEIANYLHERIKNGMSSQTVHVYVQAIHFIMFRIYKRTNFKKLHYPKRPSPLPTILSRNEIRKLIQSTTNPKHKLLLSLAYASGLRVSEVVHLKVQDIEFQTHTIHVHQGKGNKDRITIFSEKLDSALHQLMQFKKPNDALFHSERGGGLTARTAQAIFYHSLQKAHIQKQVTFHSLRHSFATHLLENGIHIRIIQELLGHANIRTTERYTRVTQSSIHRIISPL
ncbi:MAG TPA: tyrosine-type recombinase/integrase [Patescibacteria group bacterium]|nr:tyrosine-type recombinase/integrase [Patescibacteria group bacterium]